MANGAERESVTLENNYSMDELNEYISVLQKLFMVRDIVLKANMAVSYTHLDVYKRQIIWRIQHKFYCLA